jgi:hypothetical protein
MKIVGYVDWDSTPTQGLSFQVHKMSFIDAVTGASMTFPPEDIVSGQFIVAGKVASALIQTLPMFVPRKPRPDGKPWPAVVKDGSLVLTQGAETTIIGSFARWKTLYDPAPEMEDKLLLIASKKGEEDKAIELTVNGSFVDLVLQAPQ